METKKTDLRKLTNTKGAGINQNHVAAIRVNGDTVDRSSTGILGFALGEANDSPPLMYYFRINGRNCRSVGDELVEIDLEDTF